MKNNFLDKNHLIVEKIREFRAEPTGESYGAILMQIRKNMQNDGHFLIPVWIPEEDKNRFIEVSWDENRSTSYISQLQVEAYDRDGVLLEITNILSTLKVSVKSVNAFVNKKGMAIIQVGVEIRNTADLSLLIKKFKQIHGVQNVTRLSN